MTNNFELPKYEIGTILHGIHKEENTSPKTWIVTGHSIITAGGTQIDCLLTSLRVMGYGGSTLCSNTSLATLSRTHHISTSLEEAIRCKIIDLTNIISEYNSYINESLSKTE